MNPQYRASPSTTGRPDSLGDFEHLSPRTWLLSPDGASSEGLIILCTWTGANRSGFGRYITLYRELAPRARILLIETSPTILVSSYARQRASLRPAVDAVHYDLATSASTCPPRILLHILSSGGALTATQLILVLREATGAPLPLAGMVLDSAPSRGTYWQTHNAIVLSQPPSMRQIGSVLGHAVLGPIWARYALGQENSQTEMRRVLLDLRSVVSVDAQYPLKLLYLYSKADQLTSWEDIRCHIESAVEKGYKVSEELFENSPHCSHILSDAPKYKAAVQRLWSHSVVTSKL